MTEIIEKNDLTTASQDGWFVVYRVRRNDGDEVTVEARCTGTDQATAEATGDEETIAFLNDQGNDAALKYAEHAQPPSRRGLVTVALFIDPYSGGLRVDYEYERGVGSILTE
jgi:hypothetical protein